MEFQISSGRFQKVLRTMSLTTVQKAYEARCSQQFHLDSSVRNGVTLDGTDVCLAAWQLIMGVSETSFYEYAKDAAAGAAAQPHGNTEKRKPRSHIVVATAALRVILTRTLTTCLICLVSCPPERRPQPKSQRQTSSGKVKFLLLIRTWLFVAFQNSPLLA